MGINMDIRNELEYIFLDTDDLDDTAKNRLLDIVRPHPGRESLKLPWDIGEKEYDLESEVVDSHMEDGSSQWQHYGMPEGMMTYESCVGTPSMIATTIPPGVYGPHPLMYTESGYQSMTIPFSSNASNAYNGTYPFSHTQAIYASGAEMMAQPPSRENERRGGRGRGGGGGGKRESYNRMTNSNNDIQNNYPVQGHPIYSPMVQMGHASGPIHPFRTQQHHATGTPFYLPPGAPAYPQGPQMHHNSHASSYGHHSPSYPTNPHSPSAGKYRGHATYYNQENTKNPTQKHHDKRGYHQDNCSMPPFRSSNSETESPKRIYSKTGYGKSDVRNNTGYNNSNARHINNKKPPFPANEIVVKSADVVTVEEKVAEAVVEVKEAPPAVDDKIVAVNAVVEDKVHQEKEVLPPEEEKIPAKIKVEVQSPPRAPKVVENVVPEPKEPLVEIKTAKTEKPQEEPLPTKIPETPTPPVVVVPAVISAPAPPPGRTWASLLAKGSPEDSLTAGSQPPPITKLPVSRVPPVYPPVPPAAIASPPKTSSQEATVQQQPKNEAVSPSGAQNSADPAPKPAENFRWAETKVPAETPPPNNLNDPAVFRMGELLLKYQMDKQTVSLLPRGLTNRSNYCYINSILQALLACPPFYNLLMALPYPRNAGKNSSTPLIDNMARFVREFSPLAEGARMPRKDRSQKRGEETAVDVHCGVAFEPSYVYTMLKNTSCAGVFSVEGRQEDAEEFLSCLLNGISDEMLELMKLVNGESTEAPPDTVEPNANHNNDEDGWKVMGPKNKGSITRCTEFGRTPLSDIFRGQLRSRVTRFQEESTDNVQPFFTLQLDIEKAETVDGALETLFAKDRVEGMICSKTKQQIEAWKQVSLEELPVILILHLKWFDYKLDGCSKIVKRVVFPIDLKLDQKKVLSQTVGKKMIRKQNQYKLFAVTYHDGKEASKGHYVTDAFHVGYGAWVRYDDSSVKGIYEMDVLNPSPPRVPYLLYYRRCDTIGNNPPNTPRTR